MKTDNEIKVKYRASKPVLDVTDAAEDDVLEGVALAVGVDVSSGFSGVDDDAGSGDMTL